MASRLDTINSSTVSTSSVNKSTKATMTSTNTSASLIKRLQSELMSLMMSPTPGISAFPSGADMTKWNATMEGPTETPYEGLTLKLKISFPSNYPMSPPQILFRTPIYHPNVDMSGRICLDILKEAGPAEGAWSAALPTSSVLLSIQSLLGEPNNSSPLNGEAALMWDRDMVEFKRKVLARHVVPELLEEEE